MNQAQGKESRRRREDGHNMKLRNPSVYSNFKEWTAGFRVCMLVQPSLASPRLLFPSSLSTVRNFPLQIKFLTSGERAASFNRFLMQLD